MPSLSHRMVIWLPVLALLCGIWIAVDCFILSLHTMKTAHWGVMTDRHGMVGYTQLPWWQGSLEGLEFGDRILTLLPVEPAGHPISVTVDRYGQRFQVVLEPSEFGIPDHLLAMGVPWFTGVLFLFAAGVMFLGVRPSPLSRLFGAVLLCGGLFMLTLFDSYSVHRYAWLNTLAANLLPAAAIHLACRFPRDRADRVPGWRWWIGSLYLAAVVLTLLTELPVIQSVPARHLFRAEWLLRLAGLLSALLLTVIAAIRAHSLPERRQAEALFYGLLIPVTIPTAMVNIHLAGFKPILALPLVFYLAVTAMITGGIWAFAFLLRPNFLVRRFQVAEDLSHRFHSRLFHHLQAVDGFDDLSRDMLRLIMELFSVEHGYLALRSGHIETLSLADSPVLPAPTPDQLDTLRGLAIRGNAVDITGIIWDAPSVAVPMGSDACTGMLLLGPRWGRWGYSDEEREDLRTIGMHCAVALERQKARDEIQRRNRDLQTTVIRQTDEITARNGTIQKVMEEKAVFETRIADLEREYRRLQSRVKDEPLARILTQSPVMEPILEEIRLLAGSSAGILITGEPGTGKDLVARAIHDLSDRRAAPYIHVNCAAIPENLFETELFGHEPGAFTGAAAKGKTGLFEQAQSGTLFLDEIGELNLSVQAKLLRAIQDKRIRRVGGTSEKQVDVRVIAATNRDLNAAVQDNTFRPDLLSRLQVGLIHLPPLHDRPEDIRLLAIHFYSRFCRRENKTLLGFTQAAIGRIAASRYPNNIRDLQNTIWRAVIRAPDGGYIDRMHITPPGDPDLPDPSAPSGSTPAGGKKRRDIHREELVRVLSECGGNKSEAARRLGVTRQTIWAKLKKYGMS